MDCSFLAGSGVFNYRVGGIIRQGDRILLMKNSRDDFYYSPGGRVKFGESLEEALARELVEELGQFPRLEGLAFIHESFYISSKDGRQYHELGFYYYLALEEPLGGGESRTSDGLRETIEFVDLDRLEELDIYPRFFKTRLYKGQFPQHIVEEYY